MLTSLKDLDGTGRILEMDYTADYELDMALESQICDTKSLMGFLNKALFDNPIPENVLSPVDGGCSAFAATEIESGDFLMGRNYDFCHKKDGAEVPLTAVVVKTNRGKKVIGVADTYWLGYVKGFYNDGVSDLSALMAAPYVLMDGINEDGLAMGVLHLGGKPGMQSAPDKKSISTSIAMRMVLDRCSDVPSAIEELSRFNMVMGSDQIEGSFHFFLADAKGHYCILEYILDPESGSEYPSVMVPMNDKDDYRYVTNFYVHPSYAEDAAIGAKSTGSSAFRYNILCQKLRLNKYRLGYEEAMQLLGCVATNSNPEEPTSHTQWSSLYNLSKKTLDIAILKEYENRYVFDFE